MAQVRMHPDEILADESLAARLVAAQFPQWQHLPVKRVRHSGTDNAIFRLGDELAARLPRIHWATSQADKEFEWLPRLAPYLPLAVPTPLCKGAPAVRLPLALGRVCVARWRQRARRRRGRPRRGRARPGRVRPCAARRARARPAAGPAGRAWRAAG